MRSKILLAKLLENPIAVIALELGIGVVTNLVVDEQLDRRGNDIDRREHRSRAASRIVVTESNLYGYCHLASEVYNVVILEVFDDSFSLDIVINCGAEEVGPPPRPFK